MSLFVVEPGIRSTIQDLGRTGYRAFGVPPGGAFDRESHALAAALLGDDSNSACIEIALLGGCFEALDPTAIALAGAPFQARIERGGVVIKELHPPFATSLASGDRIRIGGTPSGCRCYLAVAGGFQTRIILGSRSSEKPLASGDILPARSSFTITRYMRSPISHASPDKPIRIVEGPADDPAARSVLKRLCEIEWTASLDSDRVGVRLQSEQGDIDWDEDPERPSAPVAPGAIQWTKKGPIVLGVAAGTMGGYAHFAHVINADLDRVGGLAPGDRVRFERIECGEARRIDRERSRERISLLKRVSATYQSINHETD